MSKTKRYSNHIRRLSQFLILSFALNIGLSALFIYWFIKERPPTPYCELKPADHHSQQPPLALDKSNGDIIRHFKKMSLQQLLTKLGNNQLVENGYTQRDLAIACLVNFHYFDLSKALLGLPQPMQRRTILYEEGAGKRDGKIDVYPGLTDVHYQSIMRYALSEQWPLTSQGLFLLLQKAKGKHLASLADAFYLSQEFLTVEMLINRGEETIGKDELLKVLIQGNWQTLADFLQQQKISQDLSPSRRQRLLLEYVQAGSDAAAQVILKTDGMFALRKLNDAHVLEILQVLTEKTPQAEQFALALLTSPRSDAVWELAAFRLYDYAGEPRPAKYNHHTALSRFIPQKNMMPEIVEKEEPKPPVPPAIPLPVTQMVQVPPTRQVNNVPKEAPKRNNVPKEVPTRQVKPQPLPVKQNRVYIIQEGDTLWKIAGRFKINVELLKKHNRLKSDYLKPGEQLQIPSQ
jgi:hypothetical protein